MSLDSKNHQTPRNQTSKTIPKQKGSSSASQLEDFVDFCWLFSELISTNLKQSKQSTTAQCGSLVAARDLHQVGEVKNILRHTWEHMKQPLGRATRLSRILSRTFAKLSQKPVIVLDKLKCKNISFWLPW